MEWSRYTDKPVSQVLELLQTHTQGLSSAAVTTRQTQYGPNVIRSRRLGWWPILIRQLKSPFVYLLIVAALISGALFEILDALAILLFIVINAILGFFQEYSSTKTAQALQKHLEHRSRVRREGQVLELPTSHLVPGDVVLLKPGDILPADLRFLSVQNLTLDESVLTGESLPVAKDHLPQNSPVTDMFLAKNIGFAGTSVTTGEAEAVVINIGEDSALGQIAASSQKATGSASAFLYIPW